jgi:hypothetical protein
MNERFMTFVGVILLLYVLNGVAEAFSDAALMVHVELLFMALYQEVYSVLSQLV